MGFFSLHLRADLVVKSKKHLFHVQKSKLSERNSEHRKTECTQNYINANNG